MGEGPVFVPDAGARTGMRRYGRALLLCALLALCSALYGYRKLTCSGGGGDARTPAFSRPASAPGPDMAAGPRHPRTAAGRSEMAQTPMKGEEPMHLAVVACGDRQNETITMLKSAVLLSGKAMKFHIFAEDELHHGFKEALDAWPSLYRSKFNYTVYPITFPGDHEGDWKKLFKPCASQRLFLPIILKDVDSLLYVDTDILFLQPVEDMWAMLSQFNGTQLAAMAPEHEEPRIAWYNRFARHPFYGTTGVNSGVMLMNLSRIKEAHFKNDMTTVGLRWEELLMPLLQKYKLNITWGDQDLINIIFHFNPEKLFVFPCHWNFRPDHCIYGSNCSPAKQQGVFILHGNRGVYHDSRQPAFRAIYEAVRKFPFGADLVSSLLHPLEVQLNQTTHTYCGKVHHLFTEKLGPNLRAIQKTRVQGS